MSDLDPHGDGPQPRPEWFNRARCRPIDGIADPITVSMFFPGEADSYRRAIDDIAAAELRAKRICATCPVRTDCLEFGLHEPFGIWGGRNLRERRYIARRLQGATA